MVNTESLRLDLIKKLASVEDKAILIQIRELLEDAQSINIEQYNQEIEQAEAEVKAGNFYTQDEVKKRLQKWKEDAS